MSTPDRRGHQLVTVFGSELGRMKADRISCSREIVNLAVNARRCLSGKARHRTETRTRCRGLIVKPLSPDAVILAVMDTGYGMDAETIATFSALLHQEKEKDRTGPVNRLWHWETERRLHQRQQPTQSGHGRSTSCKTKNLNYRAAKSTSRAASVALKPVLWKMKSWRNLSAISGGKMGTGP
jgi:hypothetical protein